MALIDIKAGDQNIIFIRGEGRAPASQVFTGGEEVNAAMKRSDEMYKEVDSLKLGEIGKGTGIGADYSNKAANISADLSETEIAR